MSESGYKIRNQYETHFVTFTVVSWVDLFTRKRTRDIIIEALQFCINEKGMVLYAFVIMSNHIHLLLRAKEESKGLSALIGDFKKFTSKRLINWMLDNPDESRRNWMLGIFQNYGQKNKRNEQYQVWIQNNHPEEISSYDFVKQKLDYIHFNPVHAGIVRNASDYVYSSAGNYCGRLDNILEVTLMDLGERIGLVN